MFQLPACRALAGLPAPLPGSLRARLVTPAPLQLDPRPEYVRWGHSQVTALNTLGDVMIMISSIASNEGSRRFHNHGEGPSPRRAFSWLTLF